MKVHKIPGSRIVYRNGCLDAMLSVVIRLSFFTLLQPNEEAMAGIPEKYVDLLSPSKKAFAHLATLTRFVVFPAWSDLLEALATFTIPPELLKTQKIE